MKTHSFTLILSGISEIEHTVANALFEATNGDIEFNMRDGIPYLEFRRKAASLRDAVRSAIEDVERANVGVRVIRVETDSANTIAKINADLLGQPART